MEKIVVANWKMYLDLQQSLALARAYLDLAEQLENLHLVICPSFPALSKVSALLEGNIVRTGAQNCAFEEEGAYTGEVSIKMLTDFCHYVIVGHSERRRLFGETDYMVNKIKLIQKYNLTPIVCIGENDEHRKNGVLTSLGINYLKNQINTGLENADINKILIAYEPIWAIGTGHNALPEQIEEAYKIIRDELNEVKVLYGGSVSSENIEEINKKTTSNGFLVGKKSLEWEDFSQILRKVAQ